MNSTDNQNTNHLGLNEEAFENFKAYVKKRTLGLFPQQVIEDMNKPGVQIYLNNAVDEMSHFIDILCSLPDAPSRAKAIHDETYRLGRIYRTQPSSVYCHTTRAYSSFLQACTHFDEYFENVAICAEIEENKKETIRLQAILDELKADKQKLINTHTNINNNHHQNKSNYFNDSALGQWYQKTFKKLKLSSTPLPLPTSSDSLDNVMTEEQWQLSAIEKLQDLRSKYGFEKIFIEYGAKWQEVYLWTKNIDQIMTDYCHDFNIHYQSLSLNGGVNLAYDPNYLEDNSATGTITSGVQPTLSIQYNDIQSMRRTLIHEYTHLLDRKAGMQYLKQKFPNWTDNHIYREYANKEGIYLSHQLLEDIYHHQHQIPLAQSSDAKDLSLNFMRELMTRMMSNQSVQEYHINQQNKIVQIKESMQLSIIHELLRKTGYDWPLLDKHTQESILHIPEFDIIVNGAIQSLIEQKASVVNETTFQNKPLEKGTPWFTTVESIAHYLHISKNEKESFYQNLWQKMPSIILNCEAIVQNYGMTMISGLNEQPFTLLAQSKVAKASFDFGNQSLLKKRRKYYIKPLEMLARHIESLYEADSALLENKGLNKTYPQLDNQLKDTLRQSLNHLLEIADIKPYQHELSAQNNSNHHLADTMQELREKTHATTVKNDFKHS